MSKSGALLGSKSGGVIGVASGGVRSTRKSCCCGCCDTFPPAKPVVSLTRTGTTATATVTTHGWKSGSWVRIAGADQAPYNGDFQITVTGANTFTFVVTGLPVTPATGTITAVRRSIPSGSDCVPATRTLSFSGITLDAQRTFTVDPEYCDEPGACIESVQITGTLPDSTYCLKQIAAGTWEHIDNDSPLTLTAYDGPNATGNVVCMSSMLRLRIDPSGVFVELLLGPCDPLQEAASACNLNHPVLFFSDAFPPYMEVAELPNLVVLPEDRGNMDIRLMGSGGSVVISPCCTDDSDALCPSGCCASITVTVSGSTPSGYDGSDAYNWNGVDRWISPTSLQEITCQQGVYTIDFGGATEQFRLTAKADGLCLADVPAWYDNTCGALGTVTVECGS